MMFYYIKNVWDIKFIYKMLKAHGATQRHIKHIRPYCVHLQWRGSGVGGVPLLIF